MQQMLNDPMVRQMMSNPAFMQSAMSQLPGYETIAQNPAVIFIIELSVTT